MEEKKEYNLIKTDLSVDTKSVSTNKTLFLAVVSLRDNVYLRLTKWSFAYIFTGGEYIPNVNLVLNK